MSQEVSAQLRTRLRRARRPARLGTLRRTSPLSDDFGYDRGTPIDRFYIEQFLHEHRHHIQGRVLEVKDSTYTERFGVDVAQSDVIDIDSRNPRATFVVDLAAADPIADASYDCFILTQTLQYIYGVDAAVGHAHRILRPGGALLVTVPTTSAIVDTSDLTDYWRFTPASCAEIFGAIFGRESIEVQRYGNVLTSIAFLAGMAHEELKREELRFHDGRFSMLVAVCAVKK